MSNLKYLPFVGRDYAKGINGKKVMVMGYSIYGERPEDAAPTAVQDRVRMYLDDKNVPFDSWMNTYTKFIRALSGEEISRGGSSEWWNKILFYSFIQEPLTGARKDPTPEQQKAAAAPFETILKQYKPDVVIAWGKDLYNATPALGGCDGPSIDGNATWQYNIAGHKTILLDMTHPSAGYAWTYWHDIIQALLN